MDISIPLGSQLPAAPARVKPLLRGVSHEIAFYVSLVAGVALSLAAEPGRARLGAIIYTLSLSTLFGVSAFYHRPMWTPERRQWLRRLDHSAIFLLIAGSYTPLCLVAVSPEVGRPLLWIAWSGALLGIVKAIFWSHAPRWVTAGAYVALSWAAIASAPQFYTQLGTTGLLLLGAGGLIYTSGAVVYATRRPNPSPRIFGYHEVFHVMVIVASALHFVCVARVVIA